MRNQGKASQVRGLERAPRADATPSCGSTISRALGYLMPTALLRLLRLVFERLRRRLFPVEPSVAPRPSRVPLAVVALEPRIMLSVATTTIELDGGANLLVTDTNGGNTNDQLTLSIDGTDFRVYDPVNELDAGSGATQVDAHTVDVPLADITGGQITVNTLAGDDTIAVSSLGTGFGPSLTINAGDGADTADLNGGITFAADSSLSVTADTINVAASQVLKTSGTGTIGMTADKNIKLNSASGLGTVDGGITLLANDGGTTTGDFAGLEADGAIIWSSGTGDVSLTGFGGDNSFPNKPDNQYGVYLHNTTQVYSSAFGASVGAITITGTGGDGSGEDHGVFLSMAGVDSQEGEITIEGTGNGTGWHSDGVRLDNGGVGGLVSNADITIRGTGAANGSGYSCGVHLANGSDVQAWDGSITIEGTGGNGDTFGQNYGVHINGIDTIRSRGSGANAAPITITGTGGTGSPGLGRDAGVVLWGSGSGPGVDAHVMTDDGAITITGTGGAGPYGSHTGVRMLHGAHVGTEGGSLTVTGNGGGPDSYGIDIEYGHLTVQGAGEIALTATGSGFASDFTVSSTSNIGFATTSSSITINADTVELKDTPTLRSTGALTIQPRTASTTIGVGGGSGTLNLDDTELGFLYDGFSSITIGDVANGTGAVDVDSSTFTDPVTIVGGSIAVTELNVGTNSATLTARTGNITDGDNSTTTDVTAGAVTLNAESGTIGGSGANAGMELSAASLTTDTSTSNGAQYFREADTLNVTSFDAGSGTVNLDSGTFVVTTGTTSASTTINVGDAATLGGTGTVSGPVTLASGSTVAPGVSPGTLSTGNVSFVTGSSFDVEIQGTTPGTGHDQLNVTGSVSLGSATLNLDTTGLTVTDGDAYVIIANDGSDSVTGIFKDSGGSDLAEGATVSTDFAGSGKTARITYAGNDGNDIVIVVDGPVSITPTPNGASDTYEVRANPTTGNIEIVEDGTVIDSRPASSWTSITINGEDGQDDLLLIDYTNGNPIPSGGATFNGGTGGNDELRLVGNGNVVVYTPSGTVTGNGTIVFDEGTGSERTATFTGLEPVDITGFATATLNLPGANDVLTIQEGVDYTSGGSNQALRVSGTSGGTTIETSAFWNNTTVVIDTTDSDGDDTLTLTSAANAHTNTNLTIDTGAGTDSLAWNGSLSLTGNLSVSVPNTITQAGGTTITVGGTATFAVGAANDLTLNQATNNFTGAVTVTSGKAVTLKDTNALTLGDATVSGTFSATAGAGIALSHINASGQTVNLNAGGQITDSNAGATNVTATTLNIVGNQAVTGIETAVSNLDLTTAATSISNTGALTLLDSTVTGQLDLTGSAGIALDALTATSQTVSLDAGGAITDDNGGSNNVTAADLVLEAASGIATSGDVLETTVTRLEASGGSGGMYVTNTGGLTIGGIGAVAGVSATGGDVRVTASSPLTVNENVTNSGGGNITLTSTDDGGSDDHLTINALVQASGGNGDVQLNAGTDLIVNDGGGTEVSVAGSGTIDAEVGRTTLLNANADVVSAGGTITFDTDEMEINTTSATVTSGSGRTIIQPNTGGKAIAIDLGSNPGTGNVLELSDAELDRITAGTFDIGSLATGAISVTAAISPGGTDTLHFTTGTTVGQSAGGTITETNFVITAMGAVTLAEANDVDNVAIGSSTGSVQFTDADGFDVRKMENVSGVNTSSGTVTLTATTGDVNVLNTTAANDVEATGLITIDLQGSGATFTTNTGADVESSGGGVTVSADEMDLDGTITANGAIALTTDVIALSAALTGTSTLTIAPQTASTTIGTGGGSGTLNINDTELAKLTDGFSSITIGDAANGAGAVDVDSSTFTDPVTIVGGSIAVTELNAGADSVTLTARTGNITDGDAGTTTDVTAGAATLNAENGTIGGPGANEGLDLSVASLTTDTSTGNGNQYFSEADTLNVTSFDAGSGTINLDGGTFLVTTGTTLASTTINVGDGATLGGTGTVSGPVTAASGGTVAPGVSPGTLTTGSVTFNSGSTFDVEMNHPYGTAGTDYDQLNVAGTVSLGNATLSLSGGAVGALDGTVLTIVNNDGADAVVGTFNGLAEGAEITVNYFRGEISYVGGTGNDVVLISRVTDVTLGAAVGGGDQLIITGSSAGFDDSLVIQADTTNSRYVVTDTTRFLVTDISGATQVDEHTIWVPFSSVTSGPIAVNTVGGDDSLLVDLSLGSFPQEISFDGGTNGATGDSLTVQGATVTDATFGYTDANSGTVELTGQSKITYTGNESLTTTVTNTNVTLNYSDTGEVITTSSAGAGKTKVSSTAAVPTTFNNPSTAFAINAGDTNGDTITVEEVGSGFAADVALDGQGGDDTYNVYFGAHSGQTNISDSGTGDDDTANVYATDQAETIRAYNNEDNGVTPQTGGEVVNDTLSRTVTYTATLENLKLIGNGEKDLFLDLEPSQTAIITVDGSAPTWGATDVPPGDILKFDPFGNTFTLTCGSIQTDGGNPDPFKIVYFGNIENLPFEPLGKTWYKFDMNCDSQSPTQAGYTTVLWDTLYADGLGYGWSAETCHFDRGAGSVSSTFVDLLQDGNQPGAGQPGSTTFSADVASPGFYVVTIKMGDALTARDDMQVKAEGRVMWDDVDTELGQFHDDFFLVYVTDGTLDIEFLDNGGVHPYPAVNAIEIREGRLLTIGMPSQGPLTADGVTVDTFTGYAAEPGHYITVSADLGTITSADQDPNVEGIQVLTNGSGEFPFTIQRPYGGGTAHLKFEDVTGEDIGCGQITYVLPNMRRFDFNGEASTTQAPASSVGATTGYIGVSTTDIYTSARGYGWVSEPSSLDRASAASTVQGDLRRDGHQAISAGEFKADMPNGTYFVSLTLGDSDWPRDNVQVTAEGATILADVDTDRDEFLHAGFAVTVADGTLNLGFSDLGGNTAFTNWMVNGVEIRPAGSVVGAISLSGTSGTVDGDGLTTDTINGSGAPANTYVTVSSTLGTITTADADAAYQGTQVLADGSGNFSFSLLRPAKAGNTTITAVAVDGSAQGSKTNLTYRTDDVRRFDFDGYDDTTAAGYIGVDNGDLTSQSLGYGWDAAMLTVDNGPARNYTGTGELLQDGHLFDAADTRTFSVEAKGGTAYDVRVYFGEWREWDGSFEISIEGGAAQSPANVSIGEYTTVTFTNVTDQNADGLLSIELKNVSGGDSWTVHGMDVAEHGALPAAASATPPPGIHGRTWNDRYRDGVLGAGETILPGCTVYLDLDNSGTLNAGDVSTLTDDQGAYSFTGLTDGTTYTVRELVRTGRTQTLPGGGAYTVAWNSGDVATNRNFGSYRNAKHGTETYTFLDADGDIVTVQHTYVSGLLVIDGVTNPNVPSANVSFELWNTYVGETLTVSVNDVGTVPGDGFTLQGITEKAIGATLTGGLHRLVMPDVHLAGSGIELIGPPYEMVMGDIADGADIEIGDYAVGQLWLTAGEVGDVDLSYNGTVYQALVEGWDDGEIEAGYLRYAETSVGSFNPDVTVERNIWKIESAGDITGFIQTGMSYDTTVTGHVDEIRAAGNITGDVLVWGNLLGAHAGGDITSRLAAGRRGADGDLDNVYAGGNITGELDATAGTSEIDLVTAVGNLGTPGTPLVVAAAAGIERLTAANMYLTARTATERIAHVSATATNAVLTGTFQADQGHIGWISSEGTITANFSAPQGSIHNVSAKAAIGTTGTPVTMTAAGDIDKIVGSSISVTATVTEHDINDLRATSPTGDLGGSLTAHKGNIIAIESDGTITADMTAFDGEIRDVTAQGNVGSAADPLTVAAAESVLRMSGANVYVEAPGTYCQPNIWDSVEGLTATGSEMVVDLAAGREIRGLSSNGTIQGALYAGTNIDGLSAVGDIGATGDPMILSAEEGLDNLTGDHIYIISLAPGLEYSGILNANGSVVFSSTGSFDVQLNGTLVADEYDQLLIAGSGHTSDLNGATLNVDLGFAPATDDRFVIIENVEPNSTVTGTFNGLAEGAKITVSEHDFYITYAGGDGNDVVLTARGKLDYGDAPGGAWTRTAGGAASDGARDVAADPVHGVVYGGWFEGNVDFDPTAGGVDTQSSNGSTDGFVTKLNVDGSYGWTATFGSGDDDQIHAVAMDSSGNVYVTGHFRGTVDFDPSGGTDEHTAAGDRDAFVTKLSSDGSYAWTWAMGGSSADYGQGLAADAAGTVYVVGAFADTVDFDPTTGVDTHVSNGAEDAFVTRLATDGRYVWTKTFGGTLADVATDVALGTSDAVYLTGSFKGTTDFDPSGSTDTHASNGGWDAFITKLGTDGAYGWTHTIGGSLDDQAGAVAADSSNRVHVTGYFMDTVEFAPSPGTDQHTSNGAQDAFVTKLSSDGTYVWTRTFGGSEYDSGKGVSVDSSGNVYVGGFFRDAVDLDPTGGVNQETAAGGSDAYITRLNADGSYGWTHVFGGASDDYANAVAVPSPNHVYLAGDFESTIDFDPTDGSDSHSPAGSKDAFVGKLGTDGSYDTYPTMLSDDGARHMQLGPTLGANRDGEDDGQPTANADGDDTSGTPDDEDGVVLLSTLVADAASDKQASVKVNARTLAAGSAKLDAWIDFNRDGDWADAGEQIFANQTVIEGDNTLSFTVPAGASFGDTYARFRLSSAGGLTPTGLANDGEVEDYKVTIVQSGVGADAVVNLPAGGGTTEVLVEAGLVKVRRDGILLAAAQVGDWNSLTINGTDNENDTFQINQTTPGLPATITVNGGSAGNDTLEILNGTAHTVTHTADNANDGKLEVDYDGDTNVDLTVNYTGLEPITSTMAAQNVVLDHSDASETITVESGGAGQTKVSSTQAESITFTNPSTSLTINAGDTGDDTVNVQALGSGFAASLTIDGGTGTDAVNFQTAATSTGGGALAVTAESIGVSESVNAGAGAITLTTDAIDLSASVAGTSTLTVEPQTPSATIGIGGGTGTLNLDDTELSQLSNGFSQITIGDAANGAGAVDVNSATFSDPVAIVGGSIAVTELNAGTNNVTLTARTGDITDGDNDVTTDVNGGAVTLNAANGVIGGSGANASLELAAMSLTTDTSTGGGNQYFSETDTVNVTNVNAGAGNVSLDGGTFIVTGSATAGTVTVADGATLGGSGTVNGSVSVEAGGTVSPGSSTGILSTGNLSMTAGSTYSVELNNPYATAGTDYDQLSVTGTVSLGNATLSPSGGAALNGGTEVIIINNDGTLDAVNGTFDGLAEGDPVSVGSFTGTISYVGGDGNDVTLTSTVTGITLDGSGNLIVTGTSTGADDALTLQSDTTNSRFVIADPGNTLSTDIAGATQVNPNTIWVPFDQVTGSQIQVIVDGGDDSLIVDLSLGNFSKAIQYDGGTNGATGDSLTLQGGTIADATFAYTDANSGTVALTGNSTITYTGLEPITSTLTLTNVTLNYSAAPDTIEVSSPAAGKTTVDSNVGETTTFDNPTGLLTIDGQGGTDSVTFTAAATDIGSSELSVTAESVSVDGSLQSTGAMTFTTDNVANAASVDAGTETVTIQNLSAGRLIDLGTDTLGQLALTDSELDAITAGLLRIGRNDGTAAGAINVSSAISPDGTTKLDLVTGSTVVQAAGATITESQLTLTAAGAVTLTEANDVDTLIAASSTLSLTNVDGLTVAGSGITTTGGGNVTLSTGGTLTLSELISAPGATVTLTTTAGLIADGNAATNNVTAANLVATGATGVATSGDPIETTVSKLEGSGGTGGFFVDNTGALTIGGIGATDGVTNTAGDVTITTSSPITVTEKVSAAGNVTLTATDSAAAGDDLTVNAGVTVESTGADVTLQVGDNLSLPNTSIVSAASGTVNLLGDHGNADAGTGTTMSLLGTITSSSQAVVKGESDADTITLNPGAATSSAKLDGQGGNDTYTVYFGLLDGQVDIADTTGGTDTAHVYGITTAETMNVHNLAANGVNPQTGGKVENTTESETVQYTATLETLNVYGQGVDDTFNVQPSQTAEITIDGGAPVWGASPGDTVNFDAMGNTFTAGIGVIQTDGGSPNAFKDVHFISIETLPAAPGALVQPGIFGRTWNDQDRDGVFDTDEPVVPGCTVYLDLDNSGTLNAGDVSTLSDDDGAYAFTSLTDGTTYTVALLTRSGWTQSSPSGGTHTVTWNSGDLATDLDFGLYRNLKHGTDTYTFLDSDGDTITATHSYVSGLLVIEGVTDPTVPAANVSFELWDTWLTETLTVSVDESTGTVPGDGFTLEGITEKVSDGGVTKGLYRLNMPDVTLAGTGLDLIGPAHSLTMGDISTGADLDIGDQANGQLWLSAGAVGDVDLSFNGSLHDARVTSWADGDIAVGLARYLETTGGSMGADVTAQANIGKIKSAGDLTGQIETGASGNASIPGNVDELYATGSITGDVLAWGSLLKAYAGGDITGRLAVGRSGGQHSVNYVSAGGEITGEIDATAGTGRVYSVVATGDLGTSGTPLIVNATGNLEQLQGANVYLTARSQQGSIVNVRATGANAELAGSLTADTGNIGGASSQGSITADFSAPAGSIHNVTAQTDVGSAANYVSLSAGQGINGLSAANIYLDGLAPGNGSPAQVTLSGSLYLNGAKSLDVQLNGAAAGTSYDRVTVLGAGRTVDLNGSTLNLSLGFTPAVGSTFAIVQNFDNSSSVTGTFSGMAEGHVFTPGSDQYFQISYMGGTGNDVVLTALGQPDYGDAPTGYPVTQAETGASHIPTGSTLGARRDGEADGVHSTAASADDTTGTPDDEDGVTFVSTLVADSSSATQSAVTVNVQNAPAGAKLDAWIDFDQSGSWEGGEKILANEPVSAGDNTLSFTIPAGAKSGDTYARFRLSSTGGLNPTGAASDGEVEDYQVTITESGATPNGTVALPAGGGTIQTEVSGGNVVVSRGGVVLSSTPSGSLSSLTVTGTVSESDTFVVDVSTPGLPDTINVDGEYAGYDTLELHDGAVVVANLSFANRHDGSTQWDTDGDGTPDLTVNYTGLEPIESTIQAEHVVLRYSDKPETIAIVDSGEPGRTTVLSTNGETVTFVNPTVSLAIYAGDSGDDVINVHGLGSGFSAALIVDGQGGTDTVHLRTDTADLLGQGLSVTAEATHAIDDLAVAVGRHVFYNQSHFDGADPAANANDDAALATDKLALLPGETASFANYTSYSRGINGLMADISGLADPTAIGVSSFGFRVGNADDPSDWADGPAPTSVTVREGAGVFGSDRVTLIWENGAIASEWLQVTVKADAATGLANADVFYFGNAPGESGNSLSNTFVDGTDCAGARDHSHNFLSRAAVDDVYDYNRDTFVDGTDMAVALDHSTNFFTALKLIAAPRTTSSAAMSRSAQEERTVQAVKAARGTVAAPAATVSDTNSAIVEAPVAEPSPAAASPAIQEENATDAQPPVSGSSSANALFVEQERPLDPPTSHAQPSDSVEDASTQAAPHDDEALIPSLGSALPAAELQPLAGVGRPDDTTAGDTSPTSTPDPSTLVAHPTTSRQPAPVPSNAEGHGVSLTLDPDGLEYVAQWCDDEYWLLGCR